MYGWIGAIMVVLGLVGIFVGSFVPGVLLFGFGVVVMTLLDIESRNKKWRRVNWEAMKAWRQERREHMNREE